MKKYLITCLIFPALLYSQIRLPLEKQTPPEGTSHQEMIEYLENIVGQSDNFELEFAGYSAQERTIPVVYFPQRKHWKKHATTVMIFAQQHGNEPSGKESLLMLINELYLNPVRYDFSNLNLILVPMVNPDGNETHRRRNGNDYDLNRNHVILSEPETQLLHQIFNQHRPEVTLDVHEYGFSSWLHHGYIKDFGEQIDCISNPAIPAVLKEFSLNEILSPTIQQTRERGFRANRYVITRSELDALIRHSTTDINDGRNGFGIKLTLSFILEGLSPLSKTEKIWQRAKHQLTLIETFLNICQQKSDQINQLVRNVRDAVAKQPPDSVAIHADYTNHEKFALKVTLKRAIDFKDTTLVLPDYRPNPQPLKTIKRPDGYLIENPDERILLLIKHHLFDHYFLDQAGEFYCEWFTITGSDTLKYEGRDTIIPAGFWTASARNFISGSLVIPTDNMQAAQIVQIFEPESFYGLSHYQEFSDFVAGENFPIYRIFLNQTSRE